MDLDAPRSAGFVTADLCGAVALQISQHHCRSDSRILLAIRLLCASHRLPPVMLRRAAGFGDARRISGPHNAR